jgi:putative peptidoglycan lipid II flippase
MERRSVIRSAGLVGAATLLSRFMGLIRDMFMAGAFGTTGAMSAFVIAFRMPNLFRALFGEGALSSAFIPVFVETRQKEGEEASWALARKILTLVAIVLASVTALGVASALGVRVFGGLDARGRLVATLLAIMLPYLLFICVAAVGSGLLNSLGHFFVPAATPWILNAVLVGALVLVCPVLGDTPEARIHGVAWAVLVAGILQAWAQFPALRRRGFRFAWDPDRHDRRVTRVLSLMGPVALSRAVTQVNVMIDSWLAVWIAPWAPAALFYSERLIYLPLGIFATALSTVLLPLYSGHAARGDREALREAVGHALRLLMFLMIPAAVGLSVLGEPICRLFFERREFTAESTLLTVRALWVYAPGMIVFSLGKVFVPAFYGIQDPRTPVRIGIATVALNIVLSVVFMLTWPPAWKHAGIAAATVVSEAINGVWMAAVVHRRIGSPGWRAVGFSVARTAVCAAGMGASAGGVGRFTREILAGGGYGRTACGLGEVAGGIAAGLAVYLLLSRLLRSPELSEILDAARRRSRRASAEVR